MSSCQPLQGGWTFAQVQGQMRNGVKRRIRAVEANQKFKVKRNEATLCRELDRGGWEVMLEKQLHRVEEGFKFFELILSSVHVSMGFF